MRAVPLPRLVLLLLLCLGVLGGLPLRASAQGQLCPGAADSYEPYDYETLAISTVAKGLTPSKIQNTQLIAAFITVEANTISYIFLGTPTATVGHQAIAGAQLTLCGLQTLQAFRAIRVTADALLKITYSRRR